MTDVLKKEFQRLNIRSGADLKREVYDLPLRFREDYLRRIVYVEGYHWTAKGQMARVIGNVLTKELINLPEFTETTSSQLRLIEKDGEEILMQSVMVPEHGELVPHGDGRLFASPL